MTEKDGREKLIAAARICTDDRGCVDCPFAQPDKKAEYCVDRLIRELADTIEAMEEGEHD